MALSNLNISNIKILTQTELLQSTQLIQPVLIINLCNISHDINIQHHGFQIDLPLFIPAYLKEIILNFLFLLFVSQLCIIPLLRTWGFFIDPDLALNPESLFWARSNLLIRSCIWFRCFFQASKHFLFQRSTFSHKTSLRLFRWNILLLVIRWCMNSLNNFLKVFQLLFVLRNVHVMLIILGILLFVKDTLCLLEFL